MKQSNPIAMTSFAEIAERKRGLDKKEGKDTSGR